LSQAQKEAARYNGVKVDPETARMLLLLRVASPLLAPSDAKKRAELAEISSKLEGIYGKGKYCRNPNDPKTCKELGDLEDVLAKSRNYDELLEVWNGWHLISRQMRPMYERLVALANEGAREVGFADTSEVWRSAYDMSPAD